MPHVRARSRVVVCFRGCRWSLAKTTKPEPPTPTGFCATKITVVTLEPSSHRSAARSSAVRSLLPKIHRATWLSGVLASPSITAVRVKSASHREKARKTASAAALKARERERERARARAHALVLSCEAPSVAFRRAGRRRRRAPSSHDGRRGRPRREAEVDVGVVLEALDGELVAEEQHGAAPLVLRLEHSYSYRFSSAGGGTDSQSCVRGRQTPDATRTRVIAPAHCCGGVSHHLGNTYVIARLAWKTFGRWPSPRATSTRAHASSFGSVGCAQRAMSYETRSSGARGGRRRRSVALHRRCCSAARSFKTSARDHSYARDARGRAARRRWWRALSVVCSAGAIVRIAARRHKKGDRPRAASRRRIRRASGPARPARKCKAEPREPFHRSMMTCLYQPQTLYQGVEQRRAKSTSIQTLYQGRERRRATHLHQSIQTRSQLEGCARWGDRAMECGTRSSLEGGRGVAHSIIDRSRRVLSDEDRRRPAVRRAAGAVAVVVAKLSVERVPTSNWSSPTAASSGSAPSRSPRCLSICTAPSASSCRRRPRRVRSHDTHRLVLWSRRRSHRRGTGRRPRAPTDGVAERRDEKTRAVAPRRPRHRDEKTNSTARRRRQRRRGADEDNDDAEDARAENTTAKKRVREPFWDDLNSIPFHSIPFHSISFHSMYHVPARGPSGTTCGSRRPRPRFAGSRRPFGETTTRRVRIGRRTTTRNRRVHERARVAEDLGRERRDRRERDARAARVHRVSDREEAARLRRAVVGGGGGGVRVWRVRLGRLDRYASERASERRSDETIAPKTPCRRRKGMTRCGAAAPLGVSPRHVNNKDGERD